MTKRFRKAVLIGLLVVAGGCTTEKLATVRSVFFSPTKYVERSWFGTNGPWDGYRDEKMDDRTYKIDVRGSEVTAQRQVIDIGLVRAANIAVTNGYSHFTTSDVKVSVRCIEGGSRGANPSVEFVAHMKHAGEVATDAKVYEAAEVVRTRGMRVEQPDGSDEGKQRAYLANVESCWTGRPQDPAKMKIESELNG